MLVGKSSAWQGRDNAESVEFDPDKPCGRSTASGKNSFDFLIALSENRVTLVFFCKYDGACGIFIGHNCFAGFEYGYGGACYLFGSHDRFVFFEYGCCCVFCKKGVLLYNARNNYAHEILAAGLCIDAK